ncbi:MAG: hypothetical protein H0X30_38925 [Anaerolineae bacterium]|nr:hypothetical protein [Anaerolineae bacterium]
MLPTALQLPLKTDGKVGGDKTFCTAATREPSAAFVSFQRQQPSLPPTQNVDSALSSHTSAELLADVLQLM